MDDKLFEITKICYLWWTAWINDGMCIQWKTRLTSRRMSKLEVIEMYICPWKGKLHKLSIIIQLSLEISAFSMAAMFRMIEWNL